MAEQGLDKIMSQVLPICKYKKWSYESTMKMLLAYGTEETYAHLGMSILQITAVVGYSEAFSEAYHTLEGDYTTILRGYVGFNRLEETIGTACNLLRAHIITDDALVSIQKGGNIVYLKKNMAHTSCDTSQNEVNDSIYLINALLLEKRNIQGGTSSSGRRRQITARATNKDDGKIPSCNK